MSFLAVIYSIIIFIAGLGLGIALTHRKSVEKTSETVLINQNTLEKSYESELLNLGSSSVVKLANSLPTYLVILSDKGEVLFINKAFEDFIGEDFDSFKKNWLSFVDKDEKQHIRKQWNHALKNHTPQVLQYRFVKSEGDVHYIETHLSPVKDSTTGQVQWIVTSINNSKLVALGKELEQLAAKREGILQNMEDGFISVTSDLVVDYVNFRAEIMLQLPQHNIGLQLSDLSKLFDDPVIKGHIKYVLNNYQSDNFEFSHKNYDYFIRIYPTATGLSFYFQDITSEKSSRNELKLLRTAIDKANDVVLITNAEIDEPGPVVLYANEAFERVTGYSRKEIIGKNPRMLQGKDTERKNLDLLKNALKEAKPIRVLLTNYTQQGEPYHNEIDISPILDTDGLATHFVAIERDISKQKEQEDLAFRAHKMDSIGLVTGGVAHDFNNLLTIILGNCEILSNEFEHEENTKEYLLAIADATRQGVSLTRSLLAFSKRQPFNQDTVKLDKVLDSVVPLIKTALGAQFDFSLIDDCTNRLLAGDHAQLESMFLNMAINARDAMDGAGSFTITIGDYTVNESDKLNQFLNAGPHTLIQFKDSGKGIAPEVIDKIFDPFFSTKALTKGTGLGLSMIYSYIDQCDGYVSVNSVIGKGTTFKVYLPSGASKIKSNVLSRKTESNSNLKTDFSGKTVLITEDTQMVAKVACHIFAELGFKTLLATDGQKAMKLFNENNKIDLLFTDIVLPNGLSGKDVANTIRSSIPNLPVIFTSGYTDGKLDAADFQTPNTEFLQKPYTKKALIETVNLIAFS